MGYFDVDMTVNYNLDVTTSTSIGFLKLLFRWRGSVWKAVYKELCIWLIGYYIIFAIYNFALDSSQKSEFDKLAIELDKDLSYIPLTFLLGFFVSVIVDRWKQIINNMGYIENTALNIATVLRGNEEEDVLLRRTLIRYLVLAQVLVFRNICMKVRKRFPSLEAVVRAGFMTAEEKAEIKAIPMPYNKYWVPMEWVLGIVYKKMEKDKVQPTFINALYQDLKIFRANLAHIVNYDWVPIPLAYPQVVFMAVRVYFLVCLISRQFLDSDNKVNIYVPIMTIIQFVFLVGWMKVAEALLNPLGEDDDDFEVNFLIDKNLATGMAIVDYSYDKIPPMTKDRFTRDYFKKPNKWQKGHSFIKGSAAAVQLEDSVDTTTTEVQPSELELPEQTRSRAPTAVEIVRSRINTIFSPSDTKEFDAKGEYNRRYFSQMSRY